MEKRLAQASGPDRDRLSIQRGRSRMRRREFIAGLGGAAAWPVVARARRFPAPRTAHLIVVLGFLCTGIAIDGAAGAALNIVAFGASNTSGWGVGWQQAYPARLEAMLRAKGYDAHVANAGMSFDTTGGMLRRIDSAVPTGTSIVVFNPGGMISASSVRRSSAMQRSRPSSDDCTHDTSKSSSLKTRSCPPSFTNGMEFISTPKVTTFLPPIVCRG